MNLSIFLFPSLLTLISFIHHFHLVVKNMHSCLSYYQTRHILSPSFQFFLTFSSHLLSPNHFTIRLHVVSTSLFISFINHLPYHHSQGISFHVLGLQSHATNEQSNSLSIISCPTPPYVLLQSLSLPTIIRLIASLLIIFLPLLWDQYFH